MGRSDPGLTTSTSEADIYNQSRMRSNLSLILFGLLVLLALSAVRGEEEGNSLSEDLAEARVVRSPDARKRTRGKGRSRKRGGKRMGKQRKRMVKQNKTGGNKSGKKGLFAPAAHRLVDIGGGNKSNLSCGGQYGNAGAAQLQNLTKTLFECEVEVNKSCDPANIPQPNMTFINRRKELVDDYATESQNCYDKTYGGKKTNSSDACYCWTHNNLTADIDELKTCKANKESAAITLALKNCTSAFGVCRKYEDAASTALSTCSSDTSKMTKKAANLAANNASMTAAKEKMASLASSRSVASLTGGNSANR